MNTILIVDDEKYFLDFLDDFLRDEGYNIIKADTGEKALTLVESNPPDLVLLDLVMPEIGGMEVLEKIKKIDSDIIVIIVSQSGQIDDAVSAMKLGAFDYVRKPFNSDELLLKIEKALKTQYLGLEVKRLRKRLSEKISLVKVMGESSQIKKVLKQVELIAPTNMSVIINGKSGTGKEIIANLIHKKSLRKYKPFIAIDCGAIPDTLIESELFGYEKGAFTGADKTKEGKFELANGGTFFLDEITNLPTSAQTKLLRAIEEKEITPIGGKKSISIDARIIATTNINILDAVNQGVFRDDLFHRLNQFKILLPTLVDRKEDIPVLSKVFLDEANKEFSKNINDFSAEAMKLLLNYCWPGNVRELKHAVKRAVLLEEGDYISPDALDLEISQMLDNSKNNSLQTHIRKILEKGVSLLDIEKEIYKDTEREIIISILTKVKFNKSKAATILGIDRKTLHSKIKLLDIEL